MSNRGAADPEVAAGPSTVTLTHGLPPPRTSPSVQEQEASFKVRKVFTLAGIDHNDNDNNDISNNSLFWVEWRKRRGLFLEKESMLTVQPSCIKFQMCTRKKNQHVNVLYFFSSHFVPFNFLSKLIEDDRGQWCFVLVTVVSCIHSQVLTSPKWVFISSQKQLG